jgi:hypothetical protein
VTTLKDELTKLKEDKEFMANEKLELQRKLEEKT